MGNGGMGFEFSDEEEWENHVAQQQQHHLRKLRWRQEQERLKNGAGLGVNVEGNGKAPSGPLDYPTSQNPGFHDHVYGNAQSSTSPAEYEIGQLNRPTTSHASEPSHTPCSNPAFGDVDRSHDFVHNGHAHPHQAGFVHDVHNRPIDNCDGEFSATTSATHSPQDHGDRGKGRSAPLDALFDGYKSKDTVKWKHKYEQEARRCGELSHQVASLEEEVERLNKHLITTTENLHDELRETSERNTRAIQQYEATISAMAERLEKTQQTFEAEKRKRLEEIEEMEQRRLSQSRSSENQFDRATDNSDGELYIKEVAKLNKLLSERESEIELLKDMTSAEMSMLHGEMETLQKELRQTREENET